MIFHKLKINDIRRETADCVSVSFEAPEALHETFRFEPGQHLTLRAQLDGEELRRTYSICAGALDGDLRIAVKKVPQGRFSTFVNEQLKVGDVLDVLPPAGRFTAAINPENARTYVAFAAGSGITPILSILKTVLQTEPNSRFSLIYGNKNRGSIIFKSQIEALKNKYMGRLSVFHILSREAADAELFSGRIDRAKCARLFEKLIDVRRTDLFLLCGPEAMLHEVREALADAGVPVDKIRFELFGTAQKPKIERPEATVDTPTSRITLRQDGAAFHFDMPYEGESILDAALRHGADLPFACKGGVCCTCRAKVTQGETAMDVNYSLQPDELARGFVLTCQSHPRSAEVTVDFDQK
jgi:ring-1,2-phenylacetyl-CoA epoxidase subunit PaaE